MRGLYRGHLTTVARTTLGNFVLFGTYEIWKSYLTDIFGPGRSVTIVCGILSGWCVAFCTFPLDACKSRQQVSYEILDDFTKGKGRPKSLLAVLRELKRERALYRGIGAVLLCAIPHHGMYLPCYDFAKEFLEMER